jgi:hypothetical protein
MGILTFAMAFACGYNVHSMHACDCFVTLLLIPTVGPTRPRGLHTSAHYWVCSMLPAASSQTAHLPNSRFMHVLHFPLPHHVRIYGPRPQSQACARQRPPHTEVVYPNNPLVYLPPPPLHTHPTTSPAPPTTPHTLTLQGVMLMLHCTHA